jgi:CheY-like chemotaxis protein
MRKTMSKIRVQIVEDEIFTAEALKFDLVEVGFEVCELASSGEEAIAIAEKEQPDVVLMDLRLYGKMNGIEAAKIIHERFSIPLIFMSGYSKKEIRERVGKTVFPFRVVEKPVLVFEIMEAMEFLMKEKFLSAKAHNTNSS